MRTGLDKLFAARSPQSAKRQLLSSAARAARAKQVAISSRDTFVDDTPEAAKPEVRTEADAMPAVGRAKRGAKAPLVNLRASFRDLEHDEGFPLDLGVRQIAGVPVRKARTVRFQGLAPGSSVVTSTSVVIEFGQLERAQYLALRRAFGGRTRVPYVEGRSYELADFLPPKLQALLGRDLQLPGLEVIPGSKAWNVEPRGEDKTIDLTMNCHATSYEAMRAYQGEERSAAIFLGDLVAMGSLVANGTLEMVASLEPRKIASVMKLDMKPGDLLALYAPDEEGREELPIMLHSVVCAGGGLFFEKADTELNGRDYPCRLATIDQVIEPVIWFLEGHYPRATLYRPTKALPTPEEAFATTAKDEIAAFEKAHKVKVGMPLATSVELGVDGEIRGEWLTAMDRIPITLGKDSRGHLER